MIRRRPSTTVVSLPSAFMLSRVWALASSFSVSLNLFAFIWDRNWPMACSISRCAYHTSRNGCSAKLRIAVRYAPAAARTILRRALAPNPLSPARHRQARCQPLDIPLERARQGLIEVVDVEDQVALR